MDGTLASINGIDLYHEVHGTAGRWSCCTAVC